MGLPFSVRGYGMIYILLFLLLIMIIISFFVSKFDLLSPWLISIAMYFISSLFVVLNKENWDITVSPYTTLIIIIALLAFGFGETFARLISNDKSTVLFDKPQNKIRLNKGLNLLVYTFSIVILVWYYYRMKQIATLVGYKSGQNLLIQYARLGVLQYGISIGPFLAISTFILRSLSYIYTFIFLYNMSLFKDRMLKKEIHYLIPSLFYLIQYSLSGSRGAFIEYFSFVIVILGIFMIKTRRKNVETNKKIAKYAILGLILFFIVFILLGNLKGWKGYDVKSILATYTGGSILALDNYLNSTKVPNNYFAEETLIGVNNLLSRIGIYDKDFSRILEFTDISSGISTNIYTSLRRYIQDFGVIGMLIIQYTIGVFFGLLYSSIKKMKNLNYTIIFYSLIFMAIVYQSLDEQFFTTFLSMTQIFTLLFTYLLYRLFIKMRIGTENANNQS